MSLAVTDAPSPAPPVARSTEAPFLAPPARLALPDVVHRLWLRRWLLLAAFLLPTLAGIAVASLAPKRHAAEAVLLVQTSRESVNAADLTGFGPSVVTVELLKVTRAELEILSSAEVLRDALRRAGPQALFPQVTPGEQGLDRAVEAFRQALRLEVEPGSNVIRGRLTLRDRDAALAGLTALLDAYHDRRAEVFQDPGHRLLVAELERANERLRAVDDEIRRVREENGVLDIAQDIGLAAARRQDLMQRESRVREQQVQARAQLAAAEAALAREPARVFASSEATNLAPGDDMRNQLSRLLQERAQMASNYAPNYPGLRQLDIRIAALRNAMREASRATFSTTRQVRNPNVESLRQRVVTLRLDIDAHSRQLVELARQGAEAEARNAALLAAERRLRDLGRERESLEAVARQLVTREAGNRIGEEARRQSRTGVQVVQAPSAPLDAKGPGLLIAAGGFGAGIGLSAILALAFGTSRQVMMTPDEAERALQLPVVARLGAVGPEATPDGTEPSLVNLAALLRDLKVNGPPPCVLHVVGTQAEDGRAELARALALALSRIPQADVALVDLQGDGRAHFAAIGSPATARHGSTGDLAIVGTHFPNFWISFDAGASNLVDPKSSLQDVDLLVRRLRDAFDFVVVIGRTSLEDYAMRRLAAVADLNLLVVRGEGTRTAAALRARDLIEAMGGVVLGVAFTGEKAVLPPLVRQWV